MKGNYSTSIPIVIRSFKIYFMKQTYLEIIKMIENNQNYVKNFQKCHKLLKISFKIFAGKFAGKAHV